MTGKKITLRPADLARVRRAFEKQTRLLSIHERPDEKEAAFDRVVRGIKRDTVSDTNSEEGTR